MQKSLNPSIILEYLSSGQVYIALTSFCFFILAILNWVSPLFVAYVAFHEHVFSLPVQESVCFVIVFLVMIYCFLIGGKLWYKCISGFTSLDSITAPYIVIEILSVFFKTLGAWFLVIIGILSTLTVLMGSFFLTDFDFRETFSTLGFPLITNKWQAIIGLPVLSYLILIFTKFTSELLHFIIQKNSEN